jgi:cobalt-zinc-cadmium efflux system outer membrane protein
MCLRFAIAFIFIKICGLGLVYSANAQTTSSNDTLVINVKQAEDQFLKNNLSLIAQRYNIDNASAQIITARLFSNPNFSFSNGIYASGVSNPYAEQTYGLSQLFTTAGKRNKNIQLAKINVEQAKYQFFDLLRTLKFTLRNDFYTIYFQEQSAKVYNQEINSLAKTLTVFKQQYTQGNIAEKEVLRIQSQLYSLQVEYNTLQTNIDTVQSEFKLLIKASPQVYIKPQVDTINNQDIATTVPYQRLLDSAYVNRYDLRLAQTAVDYNTLNFKLQKATAIPDVSVSLNYDKLAAYGQNFLGGGISFDLPFFNRNQGGIKQARIAIDQSKIQFQSQQDQVQSDVAVNYKSAIRLQQLYNSFDPTFKQNFNHLIQEVFKNYQMRNISLLEFLDFYDSYKTNVLQLNNLELSRVTSLEQLNYVTGTPFFNQ